MCEPQTAIVSLGDFRNDEWTFSADEPALQGEASCMRLLYSHSVRLLNNETPEATMTPETRPRRINSGLLGQDL